ncbi:Indoleamine 2,3-dioxygenase [Hyaloraphidium curvatum]|nr:Indoleamine 2,3-dioxygenase [Hyaloraphidium curvatum]
MWTPDLAAYGISPTTGFAAGIPPPLAAPFDAWEALAASIPAATVSEEAADAFRAKVRALEVLDASPLDGEGVRRACVLLGFLANAFVHGPGTKPDTLPKGVAVPLVAVSQKLGMRPGFGYWHGNLWNWRPTGKAEGLDGMEAVFGFTEAARKDEDHFALVPAAIDALGGPALCRVRGCFEAAEAGDVQAFAKELDELKGIIEAMVATLGRMGEGCSPDVFWKGFRRYLGGLAGTEFEGAANGIDAQANGSGGWVKSTFGGSTAAQSPIIQALSAFLGVDHRPTRPSSQGDPNFLVEMRNYSPLNARRFLRDLAVGSAPVREFAAAQPELRERMDGLLALLARFRERHLGLVMTYVLLQAKKDARDRGEPEDGDEAKGTGGSALLPFLKQAKQETLEARSGSSKTV